MESVFVDKFRTALIEGVRQMLWEGGLLGDIALFAIGAVLFFAVFERRGTIFSMKEVANYIVPTSVWHSPSHKVDLLNWPIRILFCSPFVEAAMAVAISLIGLTFSELFIGVFGRQSAPNLSNVEVVTIQSIVLILGSSFSAYWAHRFQHEVPLLWSFHRAHHSAEVLSIFSGSRVPLGESLTVRPLLALFAGAIAGLASFLIGVAIQPEAIAALATFKAASHCWVLFGHSHVPFNFGWLNRIITAPVLHHIHHSAERRHHDRNYAQDLSIWDWMFGTLYMPDGREEFALGLENEREENNPHRDYRRFQIEPFQHAWRTILQEGWRCFWPRNRILPGYLDISH